MNRAPFKSAVASLLSALLIALSPGIAGYQAVAANLGQSGGHAGRGSIPGLPSALPAIGGPSASAPLGSVPGASSIPSASVPSASQTGAAAALPGAAAVVPAAVGVPGAPSASPAATPNAAERIVGAGAAAIENAAANGQLPSKIDAIYAEAGRGSDGATPTPGSVSNGPSPLAPAGTPGASAAGSGSAAVPAPAAPGAPKPSGNGFTEQEVQRAIWGLTLNRLFSLISFSVGAIAYPLMMIQSIGQAGFYNLNAMGAVANIVLALVAGWVGDKMPLKKYAVGNIALRAIINFVTAGFFAMGWLTPGPALFLTILSAWQFSTLFSNDYALQTEIIGKDTGRLRSTEALIRMTTIAVTVIAGLLLGEPLIRTLGYFWTFMLVGGIQLVPVWIMWSMLPKGGRMDRSKIPSWAVIKAAFYERVWAPHRGALKILAVGLVSLAIWPALSGIWASLALILGISQVAAAALLFAVPFIADLRSKASQASGDAKPVSWKGKLATGVALAVSGALFFMNFPGMPQFMSRSPVPLIIVSGFLLLRSKTYQTIIKPAKLLKTALLFVMIGAFIEIPLRSGVLGVLAKEVTSSPAQAAAYLGSLIAAFYLGQMPSGTGMLDSKLTIAIGKGVPSALRILGGVAMLAAMGLVIGSVMSMGAGLALIAAGGVAQFAAIVLDRKIAAKGADLAMPFQRVMKWVGALGVSAWTYFVLLPKGLLASSFNSLTGGLLAGTPWLATLIPAVGVFGAAIAAYIALHNVSPKLSDKAWMRLEAAALLIMGLPLLFWGAPWALYLSLAAFGFVLNGSQRMISATFSSQAKQLAKDQFQYVTGMRGSFFNMSTSIAYALYALAKTVPTMWGEKHAFPFTWYVLFATYAVFAVVFWKGSGIFAAAKQDAKPAQPKP